MEIIGTLVKLERLNNSVYGNYYGKKIIYRYHLTKACNNIIDGINQIE